jgi:hypothetical protein
MNKVSVPHLYSSLALTALACLLPVGLPHAAAAFLTTNTSVETTLEAGNVGTNRGNDILVVGNTGGAGLRRSLISFGDIEALIGPGREITSATMTLTVENINSVAPANLTGVFSATRPWTEGIGTGASGGGAPFGATWNAARREGNDNIGEGLAGDTDGPLNWANPGGDFFGTTGVQGANPYATATVIGGTYVFDVTTLLQAWYDGAIANHGMMIAPLTSDTSLFGRVSFKTSDQTTPGDSSTFPRLDIEYVPEANTHVMCAFAASAVMLGRRRQQ